MWDYIIPSVKETVLAMSIEMVFKPQIILVNVGLHLHNGNNRWGVERPPCIALSKYSDWMMPND